jgi:hypothetical protein
MPRFKVGDRVEVLSRSMGQFSGKTGVIIAVGVSQRTSNLDKYTVRFEGASQGVFWEFQFKGVEAAL